MRISVREDFFHFGAGCSTGFGVGFGAAFGVDFSEVSGVDVGVGFGTRF